MNTEKKANYKLRTPYAVTITPCDKYQYGGRVDRYERFRNHWYEEFLTLKFKYEMFIEISEPLNQKMLMKGTLGPRLHIHGVIQFKTNRELGEFLLNTVYRWLRMANVYIHTISESDVWHSYYSKQTLFKYNRLSSFDIDNSRLERSEATKLSSDVTK